MRLWLPRNEAHDKDAKQCITKRTGNNEHNNDTNICHEYMENLSECKTWFEASEGLAAHCTTLNIYRQHAWEENTTEHLMNTQNTA